MKTRHISGFAVQLATAALALALTVGCGHSCVTRGADLYAEGNYVGAAEYFEHTRQRLESAESGERARYGLYRGATLLSLGDFNAADHWLAFALREARQNPDALTADESQMLRRALRVRAAVAAPSGAGEQIARRDAF